jgi:hypothetical protein
MIFFKNGLYYIMVKRQIGLECMGDKAKLCIPISNEIVNEIIGKREISNV